MPPAKTPPNPPPPELPHALPATIAPLLEVAYNLQWTYSPAAWSAFEKLDPVLWEATSHNPVRTLSGLSAERLAELAGDADFTALIKRAHDEHTRRIAETGEGRGWFASVRREVIAPAPRGRAAEHFLIAYFCAEFGLAECFQIYSGGLGLLAGDHLKSAADLGIPLIGVGLLYRNGYFHQAIDEHGLQQELFPALDAPAQPVRRVLGPDGRQVRVSVELPERPVQCALWRAEIGRVRLYLLDTNLPENTPEDREITANLYLGDQRRRIEQEIVLGIGGVRALAAAGEHPTVFHMNEGHAAFMALERIRRIREEHPGLSFDQAREAAAPSHIFTTHTPVPAGIDHFNIGLVQHYFGKYHASLGLDMEGFMALGRENVADRGEAFSMAVLAIRTSKWCNGVSKLHGKVSRTMWRNIWPGVAQSDVPIGHVTNGVHTEGWVAPPMAALYDRHLGTAWRSAPDVPENWARVASIPAADLWRHREEARAAFIGYCRRQADRGLSGGAACVLRPDVLTIGFARRFAGYKRATLLFRDAPRLRKILLGDKNAPGFQLVVAGKSHPGDTWGKHLIREIVDFSRDPDFAGRILFLEDYGIDVAREMVRGCDVWLNNPIRGLEASGTSGMKAAMNGVLNASILDGWWDEGFAPDLGFKIDDSGIYPSDAPDDDRENAESEALYRLLEQSLLPEFYARGKDGVPSAWVARMKRCIAALSPAFSTHRMLKDYANQYYFPAHRFGSRLFAAGADLRDAREVADHIDRYRRAWPGVRVKSVQCAPDPRGEGFNVAAAVRLAGLKPDEVCVEICHGQVDRNGRALDPHEAIPEGRCERMTSRSAQGDTTFQFSGNLTIAANQPHDRHGLYVRVLPGDERLASRFIPGLIAASAVQPLEADAGMHV